MIYQYLFYRIYKRKKKKNGEIESTLVSMMAISCIVFLNLVTIETFLSKLLAIQVIIDSVLSVIITMVSIFGLNCLMFLLKKRYKDIEQKFLNETKTHQNIGTFIIIAYIIISFILFFVSVNC